MQQESYARVNTNSKCLLRDVEIFAIPMTTHFYFSKLSRTTFFRNTCCYQLMKTRTSIQLEYIIPIGDMNLGGECLISQTRVAPEALKNLYL